MDKAEIIRRIEGDLRKLEEAIMEKRMALKVLRDIPDDQTAPKQARSQVNISTNFTVAPASPETVFANMPLARAVETLFKRNPGRALAISMAREMLSQGGFANSNGLAAMLGPALARKEHMGLIKRVDAADHPELASKVGRSKSAYMLNNDGDKETKSEVVP